MSFINDVINALGLVDEEEVYEDELEPKKEEKPKKEKPSFFKRKEKENASTNTEAAPAGETAPKKSFGLSFGKKEQEKPAAPVEAKPEEKEEESGKKGLFNVFKKSDKKEQEAPVVKAPAYKERKRPERTINLPIDNKQVNVIIIEPVSFDDCPKIADYLRNGQPVVVNFDGQEPVLTKRMTDFISGTIYALNGSMKKLGKNILVCAPRNVDIDAGVEYEEKGEQPWKK